MNAHHSHLPVGASPFSSAIPIADETEADEFNDETFGACDLDAMQIKSDFGDNGEFLGEHLPDFFDTGGGDDLALDDQSQQPSIDALLAEDALHRPSTSFTFRQQSVNPLFNMAINQAQHENLFLTPKIDSTFDRFLTPDRLIYNGAMLGKLQHNAFDAQPSSRMTGFDHDASNNRQDYEGIGELMLRARMAAMNADNSASRSSNADQNGMSSQLIDAIQRSEQISSADHSTSPSAHGQPRRSRAAKSYPRPPLLHTWYGRGPHYDAFAGLMSDREKQWIVKIQLHQVSQTADEDFYFHKWSHQKRPAKHGKRHEQPAQRISYPIMQLLESIQQEKQLAQQLSERFASGNFSNVHPAQAIPYASPVHTQLGKQSTATPRHPRCTLDLAGHVSVGKQTNAITHDKHNLGLLLHIEDLYRDLLHLNDTTPHSLDSVIDRYLNDEKYHFIDIFGRFKKGQLILERLHSRLPPETVELVLTRLYGSLCYMVRRWPTDFHIELSVLNTISLMQQQVNAKKTPLDQLLAQAYAYYSETVKPKILQFDTAAPISPFIDPRLFANTYTTTILIDLLLTVERQCYLSAESNSRALPVHIMQRLQPQLQYHLTEQVLFVVSDLCQALLACSSPAYTLQKMLKPFAQIHQQQFGLLCKFLRQQTTEDAYAKLEPQLISCCVRDAKTV